MRADGGSRASLGGDSAGVELAFAAFVLNHAGCEDAIVELRLGEGMLLEWCPMCAALEVFGVLVE